MKLSSNIALAVAFLTSSLSATASAEAPLVTVQLANDQSGANANVAVRADGVKHTVESLWGKTAVARNGIVYASSTQLTAFQQNTACRISQPGIDVTLDARHTWSWLDGGRVVDLNGASLTNGWNFCHIQLPISHAGDYDKKQDLGDVTEVTICTYFQSIYNSDPGSS
ncbi:hypothetical protein V8F44DRAFT_567771 [Aspergillus fumigatus]